jgi:hypothetical protein
MDEWWQFRTGDGLFGCTKPFYAAMYKATIPRF